MLLASGIELVGFMMVVLRSMFVVISGLWALVGVLVFCLGLI